MRNAKIIDDKDNVIVAIYEMNKGEEMIFTLNSGKEEKIISQSDIPLFHKAARSDICKNEAIIKYGECIGMAARDIKKGEHVHIHNVKNKDEV